MDDESTDLVELLRDLEHVFKNARGCSRNEIDQLQDLIHTNLPAAYVAFLEIAGNWKDGPLVGTEFRLSDYKLNQEVCSEILEDIDFNFPTAQRFAFFSRQGYQVAWFHLPTTNPDPETWFATDEGYVVRFSSFTGFMASLFSRIRGAVEITRRHPVVYSEEILLRPKVDK